MSYPIFTAPAGGSTDYEWTRPSDWVTLPTVADNEEKFVGNVAVWEGDQNFLALRFGINFASSSTNYIVDWGDGSSPETVANNTQAYHQYDYDDLGAGTYCSRGYRQAIVTVTPEDGTFTNIYLTEYYPGFYSQSKGGQWLEIKARGSFSGTTQMASLPLVEHIDYIPGPTATSLSTSFANNPCLYKVTISGTGNITNFSSCFNYCSSLRVGPTLDTSSATLVSGMFGYCSSLVKANNYDFSGVSNISSIFQKCYSLNDISGITWPSAPTSFSSLFNNCYGLQHIDLGGMTPTSAASLSYVYYGSGATDVESIDLSNINDGSYSFREMAGARRFYHPEFNPTNMYYAFYQSSFSDIIVGDLTNVTHTKYIARYCYSLRRFIASAGSTSATTTGNEFSGCYLLTELRLPGHTSNLHVDYTGLGQEALVTLFNDLGTVTDKTITISNARGAAALTAGEREIATNKGWTIVG